MIWESRYWKGPLRKSANYLARLRLSQDAPETTRVRVEKEVLIGFYSIRKLLDTFTISDKTKAMRFDLICHPRLRLVDYMNWHHLDLDYDLSVENHESRNLRFLCSQFVHSYLFMPCLAGERLGGFYVASDRERHSKCYFVTVPQVLEAFITVATDYPKHLNLVRDRDTEQWNGTAW